MIAINSFEHARHTTHYGDVTNFYSIHTHHKHECPPCVSPGHQPPSGVVPPPAVAPNTQLRVNAKPTHVIGPCGEKEQQSAFTSASNQHLVTRTSPSGHHHAVGSCCRSQQPPLLHPPTFTHHTLHPPTFTHHTLHPPIFTHHTLPHMHSTLPHSHTPPTLTGRGRVTPARHSNYLCGSPPCGQRLGRSSPAE